MKRELGGKVEAIDVLQFLHHSGQLLTKYRILREKRVPHPHASNKSGVNWGWERFTLGELQQTRVLIGIPLYQGGRLLQLLHSDPHRLRRPNTVCVIPAKLHHREAVLAAPPPSLVLLLERGHDLGRVRFPQFIAMKNFTVHLCVIKTIQAGDDHSLVVFAMIGTGWHRRQQGQGQAK